MRSCLRASCCSPRLLLDVQFLRPPSTIFSCFLRTPNSAARETQEKKYKQERHVAAAPQTRARRVLASQGQ